MPKPSASIRRLGRAVRRNQERGEREGQSKNRVGKTNQPKEASQRSRRDFEPQAKSAKHFLLSGQ